MPALRVQIPQVSEERRLAAAAARNDLKTRGTGVDASVLFLREKSFEWLYNRQVETWLFI